MLGGSWVGSRQALGHVFYLNHACKSYKGFMFLFMGGVLVLIWERYWEKVKLVLSRTIRVVLSECHDGFRSHSQWGKCGSRMGIR